MKIKITQNIPVVPAVKPKINGVYEVLRSKQESNRKLYFIRVSGEEVGIYSNECEIVDGG